MAPCRNGYARRGLLLLGNSAGINEFNAVPSVCGCPEINVRQLHSFHIVLLDTYEMTLWVLPGLEPHEDDQPAQSCLCHRQQLQKEDKFL
jgi:hypothetical protein